MLIFFLSLTGYDGQDNRQALSRTLSLAIVPGHHISSLSIAKKNTTPTNTTVELNVDEQQESDSDKKDVEDNEKDEDQEECTEQLDQAHETVITPPVVVT